MAGKKGKSKGKRSSGSSSKTTAASGGGGGGASTGFDIFGGGGGGHQHTGGHSDDSSAGVSYSRRPKGGGSSPAADFLERRRTPLDSETGGGGDFRHANGGGSSSSSSAVEGARRSYDDRERDGDVGDRDRDHKDSSRGDQCHNGESLCRSPYIRSSAGRQWSWLGYSAKQFRSFAQEFPPTLDVGANEVRLKIEDVKCTTCRDRLLKALGRGLSRGGFPLTKLVKLAACGSDDERNSRPDVPGRLGTEQSFATTTATAAVVAGRGESGDGCAPVVLSDGRGGGGGGSGGGGPSDRLRIRAPVTPDLLRQIIGIVQQAVAAVGVASPPATEQAAGLLGPAGKKENSGAATTSTDLSAERWLSTYPAPNPALLEANQAKSNGLRGTGTGSLSFPRSSFGGAGARSDGNSTEQINPWALMDRVERARDNAFKCCGVIETSTGGGSGSIGGSSNGGGSSSLLESSGGSTNGGSSSTITNSMEWNPQFAPRLQEAEAALVEWLTELTMALHGLTFQFTLAFVGDEADGRNGNGSSSSSGSSDLAESTALAEDLWTAYEESVKRQLELTLEARREQLREQSHAMGIALCFAAQNRLLASELLERKRAEITALHDATIGVMMAAKWRPLLERAENARQKWSRLLLPDDIGALDELAERVLRARLQVFKCESFAYNASSDVIQAEQMADAQLKALVQEWEAVLDSLKARVEDRVARELDPMAYPQSPALTSALQTWLSNFQTDWVGNETTQQLHAHIRQRQVQQLCQTLLAKKQRLKATKDEVNEHEKQRRKKDARAGSSNSLFSPSAEQAEDKAKRRELDERCQSLATAISLTQQEQIETCLTYRLFAVGQLHQRYRRLRLFFAQLGCRVGARDAQAVLLCGGEDEAEERIKMVSVCLMLGVMEEACLRWTAVQNERQLVEGMDREDASLDAKRRKRERAKAKVRETKTAAAAAAVAAAIAEAAEAAEVTATAAAAAARSSALNGGDPPSAVAAAVDSSAQPSPRGGGKQVAATATATATTATAAPNGHTDVHRQGSVSDTSKDSVGQQQQVVSSGEGWGKTAVSIEERSDPGWRGKERPAPAGDEDGFVTIAKSKPRRSNAARDNAFAQQNGSGGGSSRGWGGRGGGADGGRGRIGGGGGGGYGFEGKDRAPRNPNRPYEQDTSASVGFAAVVAGSSGARPLSKAATGGTWAHRNSPVAQEQPGTVALALSAAAPALTSASNGWPGIADANSGRRRGVGGGGERQASSSQLLPTSAAAAAAAAPTLPPAVAAALTAPQPSRPLPEAEAGAAGGPPMAPEEELPEAAPAPTDAKEEAVAGGLVNSTGEISGGDKAFGVAKGVRGAGGAGGAAATSSGELGPELEVAGVTAAGKGKEEQGRVAAVEGAVENDDEEEEFVFQFGTVNLSDEDAAGEDAGLDAAHDMGPEARHSPDNFRHHDGGVSEEHEGGTVTVAAQAEPGGSDFAPASPSGVEVPFDEEGNNAGDGNNGTGDGTGGPVGMDGYNAENGGLLSRQPLQTEQWRGGVFFPAHPPPPQQQQQQQQDARMAPLPFPHPNQAGGPMQQQHHQLPHHQQQQVPPRQQQQQPRGYSPVEGGVPGMSQHQLHPHHHQSHMSIQQQQRGGGMGMGGGHPSHNPARGMHHRNGPSHPKGPRGGGRGGTGTGTHSSNGGPPISMGAGQYGVAGPQQHQQSAASGYWGGGMMHYQVPGQPMMGPAPGGIGVTDGQAVYYPPPPHMMSVQGDGSGMNGHAGAGPWHVGGGGHLGAGGGMNMAMDMNGMPAAAMPWMPDGGHHYMQQHRQQQGWGGSPVQHSGGMGYNTPPLQQQQQQQQHQRSVHAAPLHPASVGGPPPQTQADEHQRQESGGHSLRGSGGAQTENLPFEHEQQQQQQQQQEQQSLPAEHQEQQNVGLEVTQKTEATPATPVPPLPPTQSEEEPAVELAIAGNVAPAAPVDDSVIEAPPVAPSEASLGANAEEANSETARPSVREAEVAAAAAAGETKAGDVAKVVSEVDGVVSTHQPEQRRQRQLRQLPSVEVAAARGQDGPAAAAMAAAAALEPAIRPKRAKKERGKKGQQQQQQGYRQGWATSNGVTAGQQQLRKVDSPEGDGGSSRTKGGKGIGRPPSTGSGSGSRAGSPAASTASANKKDLPSPTAPMPRGLVNAMGQNNCFLNVVVQSLWHLEAFRVRFGGSGDGNSKDAVSRGAWGRKPRVWSEDGSGAAAAAAAASATKEEPSHRVEASLRALFRELSEVEGGEGGTNGSSSGSGGGGWTGAGISNCKSNGDSGGGGGGGGGRGGGGGGGTGATSASVEALRTALAELSKARFGAGKMDDAAEAMETILGCLVQGSSAAVIRQVFSMRIREALVCPKCGTSSPEKPATYEANVFYAHVSALREAREKAPACSFDVALREASHGDLVACRNAACSVSRRKERLPSQRSITGEPPCVFSLGLVWNNWGAELVADLLGMLSPVVDLDVVFSRGQEHGIAAGGREVSAGQAHLRGFFCFQVQKHHYVAFVYNRGRQEWLLLDDDQAVPIGQDFAGVLARCEEDKLHPSLFFFERNQNQSLA